MIYERNGENVRPIRTITDVLKESEHLFYLTGSRYFGTNTENSDTDYFVDAQSPGIHQWLEQLGFVQESESYQTDPIITEVYQHRGEKIHVQLVIKPRMKSQIQWRLLSVFRSLKPDKAQARILWAEATRLYKDGMLAKDYGVK